MYFLSFIFLGYFAWKTSDPLEIAAEGETRYVIDLTNVRGVCYLIDVERS